VTIDVHVERVGALDEFIAGRELSGAVSAVYGVDQADGGHLKSVIDEEFGDRLLDLVVDDASHHYVPTRNSFSVLFPRLRDGGLFVIEDWDWAHDPGELWQRDGGYFRRYPALTNLLVEIMMLTGSRTDVVREIVIAPEVALVVRGAASIPDLDLERDVNTRGIKFRPLL
jgi:SAM-dependent methyltransferase